MPRVATRGDRCGGGWGEGRARRARGDSDMVTVTATHSKMKNNFVKEYSQC